MTEPLRRRYQRLLCAYPGWYRRERGLEVLTTLLDNAEPGRRWPAFGDVVDIVRGGIRCRLQLPRGPILVIVAAAVAVFAGVTGCSLAATATAAAFASPPTEDEAVAVSELAMGQRPRNVPGPAVACTYFCPNDWVIDGDQVMTFDEPFEENQGVDHVTIVYWTSTDDLGSMVSQAWARLAANGWSLDGARELGEGAQAFRASKDGLFVDLVTTRDQTFPSVFLHVERDLPAVVVAAGVAGLLGGLLIGWMLAAWTMQRHRRHHAVVQAASIVWAVPTLVVLFLVEAYTANYVLAVIMGGASVPLALVPILPAFALSWILISVAGPVIGAVMLVNLALAAFPARSNRASVAQATPSS
jgi:hypothetical protein